MSSIAGIPDERAADVALLVSELVSNAVRHGPGGSTSIAVRVAVAGSWARVEVEDSGRGFEASTDDPSGTGLRLVDLLSDRWGIADEGRTFVWFELGRTSG